MLSSLSMNDREGENPSRDALLLQLLKTPPQPRAQRKRHRPQTEGKANRTQEKETREEAHR
jgi:hypothetical protein